MFLWPELAEQLVAGSVSRKSEARACSEESREALREPTAL